MKELNLNTLGVEEMNVMSLVETNGGFELGPFIIEAIVAGLLYDGV